MLQNLKPAHLGLALEFVSKLPLRGAYELLLRRGVTFEQSSCFNLFSFLHMFARSSRDAVGLLRRRLSPACRETSLLSVSVSRHHFAQYHDHPDDDSHESQSQPRRPRIRRHGLDSQKAQKVVLDVNALGKPGEVVIVPPRKGNRRVRKETVVSESNSGLSSILEEIEKEKNVLDFAEVDANIEEFRLPYGPHDKLNYTEWKDLRQKLEESFTSSQLGAYISRFKPSDLNGKNDEAGITKGNWKPGTSLFLEMDPLSEERISDRTAATEKLSGKGLLAERILRDCWILGVAGEVGQLDLRLPSHAIALLLNSEHFSFRDLAQYHHAKIDVTHSLNLVRITGDERSCTQIYDQIQSVTARIQKEVVNLSLPPDTHVKDRHLAPEFIQWIEQNHRVFFERKGRDSKGTMYYLGENRSEADTARRNIDVALYRKRTGPIPFCTYLPTSEKASAYSVNVGERAPLFDRDTPWFRWALASTQTGKKGKLLAPLFDQHRERLSSDLLDVLRHEPALDIKSLDRNHVSENLTATVGQCLFLDDIDHSDRTFSAARLGELSSHRIFVGNIPKITPFIRVLTPFPGTDRQTIHRFRLTPSIMNSHALPPLDLEIGVVDGSNSRSNAAVVIRSAKAVVFENSIDYLLPESSQDLRFTRTTHYDLLEGQHPGEIALDKISDRPEEGPFMTSIIDLLQNLPFHAQGEESQHPSKVFFDISLPRKLIRSSAKHADIAEGSEGSAEFVQGTFDFPPLLKFSASRFSIYDFHGERLNYSYCRHLPPFGDESTVLSLDMDVMSDKTIDAALAASGLDSMLSSEDALKQEFHYFYNTACKLAFELGGAGTAFRD